MHPVAADVTYGHGHAGFPGLGRAREKNHSVIDCSKGCISFNFLDLFIFSRLSDICLSISQILGSFVEVGADVSGKM